MPKKSVQSIMTPEWHEKQAKLFYSDPYAYVKAFEVKLDRIKVKTILSWMVQFFEGVFFIEAPGCYSDQEWWGDE